MRARTFFPEEPDGPHDGRARRASTRPLEELRWSRGRPPRRGPRRGRLGGNPRLRAERQREDHPPLAPRRARRAESWFRGDRREGELASEGIRPREEPPPRLGVCLPEPEPHRRPPPPRRRPLAL